MNNELSQIKESEVTTEMQKLEKIIEQVNESIHLKDRVSPVLKIIPPCGEVVSKEPENLVPLATMIRQFRNKLSTCNNEIRSIIERCEL